jgi:hypothetical protein
MVETVINYELPIIIAGHKCRSHALFLGALRSITNISVHVN